MSLENLKYFSRLWKQRTQSDDQSAREQQSRTRHQCASTAWKRHFPFQRIWKNQLKCFILYWSDKTLRPSNSSGKKNQDGKHSMNDVKSQNDWKKTVRSSEMHDYRCSLKLHLYQTKPSKCEFNFNNDKAHQKCITSLWMQLSLLILMSLIWYLLEF